MKKYALIVWLALFVIGCSNDNGTNEKSVEEPKLGLHAAIYVRDYEAIQQHIKAGSDINIKEPSRESTPLITAVFLNEPKAVKLLMDAGADLNYKNQDGSTALHTAAVFGRREIADLLINGNADLNIKNNEGSTPLHLAAFFCYEDLVRAMIEKGADKEIINNEGNKPIDVILKPFNIVKERYEMVEKGLKPLGLELDYERIEKTRPIIAEILK